MHVHFAIDADDCRFWLVDFVRRIETEGHVVSFEIRNTSGSRQAGAEKILRLESKLYALTGACPWQPLAPSELPAPRPAAAPDVTVDLSPRGTAACQLYIADHQGVGHLSHVLRARQPFAMSIRHRDGRMAAQAVPANADVDSLWRSLDTATARLATLLILFLRQGDAQVPAAPPAPQHLPSPLGYFAASFARKLLARFAPERFRADHWRVGIRRRTGGEGLPAFTLDGFSWLDDGGECYYADPALVERDGRTWLFLERFCYARMLGEISVVELDDEGKPLGKPRHALVREGHLSFPVVFTHEGETYLTVENAGEGHLPLYRAREFPHDWEELPPLLPKPVHDPVPVQQQGRWWILGNPESHGGSSCDVLAAFCAPTPIGPFTPERPQPFMLDARFARAGGLMFAAEGQNYRVMQDCCTGYGSFLRFAPLEALSDHDLTLGTVVEWHPPRNLGISGMHTYTRSARFEAIDILTPRRWKPV